MSGRTETIAMLAERIKQVSDYESTANAMALLSLATAALAMETLCQAETADKKAKEDYNQQRLGNIGSGKPGK